MTKNHDPLGCLFIPGLLIGGVALNLVLGELIQALFPGDNLALGIGLALFLIGWTFGLVLILKGWLKKHG